MSQAMLLVFLEFWSGDQDGISRLQAGKQDGRLEGQDECVIIVALESLNEKLCFPLPSAASKLLFSVCHR